MCTWGGSSSSAAGTSVRWLPVSYSPSLGLVALVCSEEGRLLSRRGLLVTNLLPLSFLYLFLQHLVSSSAQRSRFFSSFRPSFIAVGWGLRWPSIRRLCCEWCLVLYPGSPLFNGVIKGRFFSSPTICLPRAVRVAEACYCGGRDSLYIWDPLDCVLSIALSQNIHFVTVLTVPPKVRHTDPFKFLLRFSFSLKDHDFICGRKNKAF